MAQRVIVILDGQIRHLPGRLRLLAKQALAYSILVAPGEGGVDEFPHPRMTRVQRHPRALGYHLYDFVRI